MPSDYIASCECGERFRFAPEQAGKIVQCPACGEYMTARRGIASPPRKRQVTASVAWGFLAGLFVVFGCIAFVLGSAEVGVLWIIAALLTGLYSR